MRSAPLRPAPRTRTRTSPVPGRGSGCSAMTMAWSRMVAARMVSLPWSAADEQLAGVQVLGSLLRLRPGLEPGLGQPPEPGVPAEQAQPVRLVHDLDLVVALAEQIHEVGAHPGVVGI